MAAVFLLAGQAKRRAGAEGGSKSLVVGPREQSRQTARKTPDRRWTLRGFVAFCRKLRIEDGSLLILYRFERIYLRPIFPEAPHVIELDVILSNSIRSGRQGVARVPFGEWIERILTQYPAERAGPRKAMP